jgi:phosphate acetyltransferase
VVFPEAGDFRIQAAAEAMRARALAAPILLDDGATSVAPAWIGAVRATRPSLSETAATRLLAKPLYRAAAMVACGEADAMVAGVAHPTRRVIEAALMTIGLTPGITTPSSCFLMDCPHAAGGARTLVFADCAVVPEPDADALAAIALATADTAAALLDELPRIALLSFATRGSAQHPRIETVRAALDRVRAQRPDLASDGELQADAALLPHVAEAKGAGESAVAGRANVLIFPDLGAGNIAYKLVQVLGGARPAGPLLQGFAKPIADLSRGADVEEIVATTIMTLARAAPHA